MKKTKSASEILKPHFKEQPDFQAMLDEERLNNQIAQMIYDARTAAGLTQGELARLIGTTQPTIARLEDANYQGHSLRMLRRIAAALDRRIVVFMQDRDSINDHGKLVKA